MGEGGSASIIGPCKIISKGNSRQMGRGRKKGSCKDCAKEVWGRKDLT